MSAFLVVVIALAASIPPGKGMRFSRSCMGVGEGGLSSQHDLKNDVRALLEGQSICLGENLYLDETIAIDMSNVGIVGTEPMTQVHCPPDGGAFLLRGTNITLTRLNFTNCEGGPTVVVEGDAKSAPCSGTSKTACKAECKMDKGADKIVVDQCFFKENNGPLGGALSVTNNWLLVVNCTFIENHAEEGGAIYASASCLQVDVSTFESNSAKKTGGAIRPVNSVAAVFYSNFSSNSAVSGGAFDADLTTVTLENLNFTKNSASYVGGAVAVTVAYATVTDTSFYYNSAEWVGALSVDLDSETTINKAIFIGNAASSAAGGVRVIQSTLTLTDSNFVGNSAKWGGGLSAAESDVSVKDVILSENAASFAGGALHLKQTKAKLTEVECLNNSAPWGGAIRTQIRTNIEAKDCRFEDNSAENGGAIILQDLSPFRGDNLIFNANTATLGGALYSLSNRAKATLSCVTFKENGAEESGGAVYLINKATLELIECEGQISRFDSNGAAWNGGGLFCDDCVTEIGSPVEFSGNFAGNSGGGVYLNASDTATLANMKFTQNMATNGGALAAEHTTLALTTVDFTENTAEAAGGALWLNLTNAALKDVSFADNTAVEGGAMQVLESLVTTSNVAIAANAANALGGTFELLLTDATLQPPESSILPSK